MTALHTLSFDTRYTQLPAHLFQVRGPTPLPDITLMSLNPQVLAHLGLKPEDVDSDLLCDVLSGQKDLPGSQPIAMKYTGHQFGAYNPDLGDGRGLLLGEVKNPQGVRWDLHLKGAGTTAFSRFGDGRAVVRSSIREYLAGPALRGLGIPTTEALAVARSSKPIQRERVESAATLLRVSRCHIRFGHFEYLYYTRQHADIAALVDYCIERFYPACAEAEQPALALYQEVVSRTAKLIAQWQAYGFVHGVMNTDNMSILGETFDYGPYAFMDEWQSDYVANHSDHHGRYAYDQQPGIGKWNLACLGQALTPLVEADALTEALNSYDTHYDKALATAMNQRLGLTTSNNDGALGEALIKAACDQSLDLNRWLYALSHSDINASAPILAGTEEHTALQDWRARYAEQCGGIEEETRRATMRQHNPRYILRTYMAQEVIEAVAQDRFEAIDELVSLLDKPYDVHASLDRYAEASPPSACGLSLSCSS